MSNHKTFEHKSTLAQSAERVMAFHAAPDAFTKLVMPPTRIQIVHDTRTSLTDGEIVFTLWLGIFPIRWRARHEPGPIPTSFTDRMLHGPLAFWVHQHIFRPTPHGTELIDRITLAHHPGPRGILTRLVFDGLALRLLFIYRHWRTRRAVC